MKLYNIVFSPTGGTKKVADYLTGALEGAVTTVDLTDSKQDFHTVLLTKEDVAVISVPSYGGRVPAVATERLRAVQGSGARAVLVCVYGNRAYEDTLVEPEDAAKQAGFQVIAAVAAIAEHSIARQFAAGRPDVQDAAQLSDFAKQIQHIFSQRDIEVLAQLCAYPVYVTTEANTEGLDVADAAGLKAQKDDIFTDAMLQAVAGVDPNRLTPSQAGIFVGSESGSPGLFFSLAEDGYLKIMGINAEVLSQ